jgi:hypothetical protein
MHEPNLFNDLFNVRIREGHSPKENFLSECFAHVLRIDGRICESWVSKICGRPIRFKGKPNVSTRTSEIDPLRNAMIFPDLRIDATTTEGEPIIVLAEHKWDSSCRIDQLAAYRRIAEKLNPRAALVFVGARRDQVEQARLSRHVDRSFYWEEAYRCFENLAIESKTLEDFLFFMKSQGLGPVGAVTPQKLKAFVESNDLLLQLSIFCRKLADEYEWNSVPERYLGPKPLPVEDRFGRIAIELVGAKWAPAITLGFLYSGSDHRVPLTDPSNSIDLFLRIEADPKLNPKPDSVVNVLAQKLPQLREAAGQVFVKGDANNRNNHTLLIVQQSLTNVLRGVTETHAQLEKIYQTLDAWLCLLFQDGLLEAELLKLKSE